jgi:hypothetical protein
MHTKIVVEDINLSTDHQLGTDLSEAIMDLKMEVKLGKLLQLCP